MTILLVGCKKGDKVTINTPIKVWTEKVTAYTEKENFRFSGTVEEATGTTLSFPVVGTIKAIYVRLGQHIAKGQLLASLDQSSMSNNYNVAKVALEQAEDAYIRMKKLHDNGSLPEIQWVEVQSKLQQAQSFEKIAAKNLADCNLYAPFNGVVAEKNIEIGQNVMPNVPIIKLVSASLLKVKIAVPETEIANISINQNMQIIVPALNGKTFGGKVVEKGIVANPISRSYDVKIRINDTHSNLMPGMVTEVFSAKQDYVSDTNYVISANIVQLDEKNNSFVWIVKDGKACKRIIHCNKFTSNGVVVSGGLQNGDQIIVKGQQKVSEGTIVTADNSENR